VSYRRQNPSRRAQQTRGEVVTPLPLPKADKSHRGGFGGEPPRSSAPPVPPPPADVTRAPRIHPLLPNSSAAQAILESRARASGRLANGDDAPDALQFVRVSDVCRLLRISKPTLWRLRRAHEFPEPTELTDRVIAWRRCEVEAWLRERAEQDQFRSARASNQPRPPLTENDDAIRAAKKAQPEAAPIHLRRSKAAQRKSSDEQLVLPLMARD
jgi:predicted DNA-binding transcriptional regulator AlpA